MMTSPSAGSYAISSGSSTAQTLADMVELGEVQIASTPDGAVVTFPVTKKDPNAYIYGMSMNAQVDYNTDLGNGQMETEDTTLYFNVPQMDFYTDTVYTSAILYGVNAEDILGVFTPESDWIYSEPIEIWKWSVANGDSMDVDTLRKALENSSMFARGEVKILSDGVEHQDGIVSAEIAFPDKNTDEIPGNLYCNILFKKDGKVVFADTLESSLSSGSSSTTRTAYPLTYTPGHAMPAYDSVEIIPLS